MKNICVFCGSRSGINPAYEQSAVILGEIMACQGLTLVYGGAKSGLMGVLAESMLSQGGQVIGVMSQILVDQDLAHPGLTRLHVVETIQDQKKRMFELADAFVALPGGTGTLDELSEILCLVQVGVHQEPIGLLEVEGFFSPWLKLFDHMVEQGFLQPAVRELLLYESDPAALLRLLATKITKR